MKKFAFAVCIFALAAGALAIRLPRLAGGPADGDLFERAALALRLPKPAAQARPMHGDEANQAVKAGELFETGRYEYDPQEHHGPTLYWLTLPSLRLCGANGFADSDEFAYRIVPVVLGAALILLLPLVADGIGRPGALTAGLLIALSPAMVFYSRYYIQEMLLVFFTFAAIGCGWRYLRSGRTLWAAAAGACFGLMHATKETWVLAAAAMAGAVAATLLWSRMRDGAWPEVRSRLRLLPAAAAAIAFVAVATALYSSFGRQWSGPLDSITAYATYVRRGTDAGPHANPWYFYFERLFAWRPSPRQFWSEGLLLALSAMAAVTAMAIKSRPDEAQDTESPRPSVPFLRFLAFYTVLLASLYSAVSYKTPWCMLSFLHPMAVLAGVGMAGAIRLARWWPLQLLIAAAMLAGTGQLVFQSYRLNYVLPADPGNPYVYAHPRMQVLDLARFVERLASVSEDGNAMLVHVVRGDGENEWPLPWYLRQLPRTGYWADAEQWRQTVAGQRPAVVVVYTEGAQEAVEKSLPATSAPAMKYDLRPGVKLFVYVDGRLWERFAAAQ